MRSRIINFFNLGEIGLLELILALFPILSGYSYGFIHINDIVLLLLCAMSYNKKRGAFQDISVKFLLFYFLVHEFIVWLFFAGMPSYMLNNTLSSAIYIVSILIISPAIDFKKYIHSLMWVSVFVIIGLIYHFLLIRTGHSVTPIKFPLLPDPPSTSRLYEVGNRPVSFFWEPASCATFLMVPLFCSLTEKKYLLSVFLILCLFLSTSSTAILLSMIMCALFVLLSRNTGFRNKFLLVILMGILIYVLLHVDMFSYGVEKIENTDIETTSRLYNGPELFKNMPLQHFVTGIPSANITDYYFQSGYIEAANLIAKDDTVFIPSFYLIFAKLGIVGIFLYILTYIKPIFINRNLSPYIFVYIIAMFFQSIALGCTYAWQLIFIHAFLIYHSEEKI